MKYNIIVILLSFAHSIFAQNEVNIYTERKGSQVIIYADNPSVIPMTANLQLDLTNMKTDFGGNNGIFVIPQRSKQYQLATAKAIRQNGRMGLRLESFVYLGDIQKIPDHNFQYELPFGSGETYAVSQGYNGRFSHKGQNAIDFSLEIGDKVYAARGGIVYEAVESNTKSCNHPSCQEYNNFIIIYHSDGTFSEYSHLRYNGANVSAGDEIVAGDFIGYSGNTGWSSGPHLHFVVYKYNDKGQRETLKTKFRTVEYNDVFLEENKSYTKR